MTPSQNILALIHEVAILFPVFLIIFSINGFFVTWLGSILGDNTAKEEGFFTLNPMVHLDVINLGVFCCVIYFIGAMLGDFIPRAFLFLLLVSLGARWHNTAPFSPSLFKHPRLYSIIYGLGATIGFLLTGFLGLVIVKLFNLSILPKYAFVSIVEFLRSLIDTAIFFGVIHSIPLPPLHAAIILYPLTKDKYHYVIDKLYEYDFMILLAIYLIPGISHFFWGLIGVLQFFVKSLFISILF